MAKKTISAWARLWAAAIPRESRNLRQGMWYRVIDDSDAKAITLEVQDRTVRAPRRLFEIRDVVPKRFTVVYRSVEAPNPVQGTKADLGRVYGVCPQCGNRVRLNPNADLAVCGKCDHRGEVAWWETG